MRILIILAVTYLCSGGQILPRVESTNYSEDSALEDEEINNVDGNLHLDEVKIPYSEHKTKVTEQSSTTTLASTEYPQKQNPDKSFGSYSTTPSIEVDDQTGMETSWTNKHLSNDQNGSELLGSASGILTRKQVVQKDSQISDIPADELVPLSTGDYSFNSESNTAVTTKEVNKESTTISGTNSQSGAAVTSSESPIIPSETVGTTSSETSAPSESGVQPEETSEQPTKTSEVTVSATDSDKRKTPGATYVTTEKVPETDTPVYPIFPTFTTRPPITKGQLDIKISIPNIFHLSLGDTPDGRRRLGIQAPFFKFDLTKPRFFKVFHK